MLVGIAKWYNFWSGAVDEWRVEYPLVWEFGGEEGRHVIFETAERVE